MQAYPGQCDELNAPLAAKGAGVDHVTPYRYASHEEDQRVASGIDEMVGRSVNSSPSPLARR